MNLIKLKTSEIENDLAANLKMIKLQGDYKDYEKQEFNLY